MRPSFYHLIATLFAAALILAAGSARAEFSAVSVTSAGAWEEEDGTSNSGASQYLNLWTEADITGFHLDIEGYGRVAHLEEEVEPGDEDPGRLYHLTLGISDSANRGRLVVGRQFVPALTGAAMIDGARLSLGGGGLTLNARWGFASDISEEGGEDHEVFGAGLDYRITRGMYFNLDYGRTYYEGLLTELIAAEWTYSWYRFTKAYAMVNWDLMSRTLHESLFGTRLFFSDRFSLIVELSQSVPCFDSDSIYSVFAVESASTRSFSLLLTPSDTTRYVWNYSIESYQGDGPNGRESSFSGHWAPGLWRISAGLLQHTGFGGDLTEITSEVSTRVGRGFRIAAGADFSRTENEDEDSVNSHSLRIGTGWDINQKSSLDLGFQVTDDEIGEPSQSTRLSLKMEF